MLTLVAFDYDHVTGPGEEKIGSVGRGPLRFGIMRLQRAVHRVRYETESVADIMFESVLATETSGLFAISRFA